MASPSGPFMPSFTQIMPIPVIDAFITSQGIKLGWMKSHACPCCDTGDSPGAPRPECQTCFGRGTYWDPNPVQFTGLVTYMHTAAAPDEPGATIDDAIGTTNRSEPTLTIPSAAAQVWGQAGEMDAYVEYDATTRRQSTLVVGARGAGALPYPFGAIIAGVTAYNPSTLTVGPVPALGTGTAGYVVSASGGSVTLTGYAAGTAYVVEYTSSPLYVAYRSAGGLPHRRPFGRGAKLPLRFHLSDMDVWIRQRFPGDGPQGFPPIVLP